MIERGAPPRAPGTRLRAGAGIVLFAYAFVWAAGLALAAASRPAFATFQRAAGSAAGRVLLAAVIVAAIFHTADGIDALVQERSRTIDGAARPIRGAVVFVVLALGVPATLVVLWPVVKGWWA